MIKRITALELRDLILTSPTTVAIVDVRDDDFYGGQIIGAQNIPSHKFAGRLPDLIEQTRTKQQVVFHCALS